jgi:hypothetical protein
MGQARNRVVDVSEASEVVIFVPRAELDARENLLG